ncbi:MAG: RNA polymerase sigma factor [Bryobacterales bacterium]|nr:RNA polymerase sigma factor [Bryobacterales bacterium]
MTHNPPTPSYSEDVRLMLAVKSGDDAAMDQLYQRHRERVVKLLYSVVRDADLARDLSQDVFLTIFQVRHKYEPTAEFSTWVYRIALNRGLKWLRTQRIRQQESLDAVAPATHRKLAAGRIPTPESLLLSEERSQVIESALGRLPQRQRRAVQLHKWEDRSYHEIGQELNCSLTAVKSILFRSYASLREHLA